MTGIIDFNDIFPSARDLRKVLENSCGALPNDGKSYRFSKINNEYKITECRVINGFIERD